MCLGVYWGGGGWEGRRGEGGGCQCQLLASDFFTHSQETSDFAGTHARMVAGVRVCRCLSVCQSWLFRSDFVCLWMCSCRSLCVYVCLSHMWRKKKKFGVRMNDFKVREIWLTSLDYFFKIVCIFDEDLYWKRVRWILCGVLCVLIHISSLKFGRTSSVHLSVSDHACSCLSVYMSVCQCYLMSSQACFCLLFFFSVWTTMFVSVFFCLVSVCVCLFVW